MKNILWICVLTLSPLAFAENFICKTQDGPRSGALAGISAPDEATALETTLKILGGTRASCERSLPVERAGMSELPNKKWGFQGLISDETYLVFKPGQMWEVQECGSEKNIYIYSVEAAGEKTLRISYAETVAGACNPLSSSVFKSGSVLTLNIYRTGDGPWSLLVNEARPGDAITRMTAYKVMEN